MTTSVRVRVRARPGARRTAVLGRWEGPTGVDPAVLVSVSARAVDGRANAAVCAVIAEALGVRTRDVTLIAGHRSRDKVVEVVGDAVTLARAAALTDR